MAPHVSQSLDVLRALAAACRSALLVTTMVSLLSAQIADAQRLSGRLLDLDSNEPIADGTVTLLSSDRSAITTEMSDANGAWSLEAPAPGIYYIAARRVGYQPWVAGPLEVGEGDRLESVFHLRAIAVLLDPVEVRAAAELRNHLALAGFYERQRGNFGHFMDPDDIEKRRAMRVTDLLTAIPGVNLSQTTSGSVGPVHVQLRGSNLSRGGLCRPRVFVDGLIYMRGDSRPVHLRNAATERMVEQLQRIDQSMSLDDIGHPSTIAAIEIYRSASQVPVQFGGTSVETLCGVIVLWTRRGIPTANR